MYNERIWFCGVPGSKWSGIDIALRNLIPADRTDETPERTFYHRPNKPTDLNNGHRGSYWGPGMGCGEDWIDFNYIEDPQKLLDDIDQVFTGDGYKIIKSHFFARHWNLDYIWNNFKGDYLMFVYREPQKSFAWWSQVMDFSEGHYPDYRPGYTDYNTLRPLIWEETVKMLDFAIQKNMKFECVYENPDVFDKIPGYNKNIEYRLKQEDVYVAYRKIT